MLEGLNLPNGEPDVSTKLYERNGRQGSKGPAKGITGLDEYVASFFGQLISFSAVGFQKYRQNTTF